MTIPNKTVYIYKNLLNIVFNGDFNCLFIKISSYTKKTARVKTMQS